MSDVQLQAAFTLPAGFRYGEAANFTAPRAAASSVPSLGPLSGFAGDFRGRGFNLIFRPDSTTTPTPLPKPVTGSDNVLELNLTEENLSFRRSLGSVPNRGSGAQGDVFLNGVPYLQTIQDVTVPSQPVGIHFEPGMWLTVPSTDDPAEGATVVRMASIPHGTTIEAQGKAFTVPKPKIDPVDITPFVTGQPGKKITFPSQTASNSDTARIPQDLTAFMAAGTITKDMLDNPNSFLSNHISTQTITATTVLTISTDPASPLFGGGTDNIAFLLGDAAAAKPNAQALKMDAIFWIETVQYSLEVPAFEPGQPPLVIPAETGAEGQPVPRFLIDPPVPIEAPRTIQVSATQIQYTQTVFLNFAGLTWPHVSVATLVPHAPVRVPASAFA